MAITLHVDKLIGGVITVNTERNPSMTRLWWTTPRSGNLQNRYGGDYSDVAITGPLSQLNIEGIDGHSRTDIVAVEIGNTVTSIGSYAFSNCSQNLYTYDEYGMQLVDGWVVGTGTPAYGYYGIENNIRGIADCSFINSRIEELFITNNNWTSQDVVNMALYWGLGIDTFGQKYMVIVHCSDGTVVINGNDGSSSSS